MHWGRFLCTSILSGTMQHCLEIFHEPHVAVFVLLRECEVATIGRRPQVRRILTEALPYGLSAPFNGGVKQCPAFRQARSYIPSVPARRPTDCMQMRPPFQRDLAFAAG